jgi:predicted DNA-binding transcriptional regulator AlpA
MTDRLLSREAAALAGVKRSTWWAYVARGQAPPATEHVGRIPLWDRATVEAWMRQRPRAGRKPAMTALAELNHALLRFPCTHCGAARGKYCVTKTGNKESVKLHAARYYAARDAGALPFQQDQSRQTG